jgi:hypothetical protein
MVDIFWGYLYDHLRTIGQDFDESKLIESHFQPTHSRGNSGQSFAVSESSHGSGPVDPEDVESDVTSENLMS